MFWALPKLSTPTIGVLAFVFPLVAIIVDWLVLPAVARLRLGPLQAAGMGLIMVGTLGVQLGWSLGMHKETVAT